MDTEARLQELSQRVAGLEQSTERRLTLLERQLAALSSQALVPPAPVAPPPPVAPMPPPPDGTTGAVVAAPRAVPLLDVEAILRWIGVGLVVVAGLFLVSTAITRGWITPTMQLLAAASAGAALLAGSLRFRDDRPDWSSAMGLGGSFVLISSAGASYAWLGMVTAGTAGLLVAGALTLCVGAALRTRFDVMAAGAAVTALLSTSWWLTDLSPPMRWLWAGGVVAATSAVGIANRWPLSRLAPGWLGALITIGLAFGAGGEQDERGLALGGVLAIAATLWAGPNLVEVQRRVNRAAGTAPGRAVDVRTLALVPGYVWLCLIGIDGNRTGDVVGRTAIGVALFFALVGAATALASTRTAAFSTLLGASGLLSLGTAILVDGPALLVALTAQSVVSVVIGRLLDDRAMRFAGIIVGLTASTVGLHHILAVIGDDGFANVPYAVATLLPLGLWTVAAANSKDRTRGAFTACFAGAWIGLMLWLAAALLAAPQGLGLISGAWALLAAAGLAIGLARRIDLVRVAGLLTLGATLVKLFTVDLEAVDVLARVALFFLVGVGLIVLGMKVPAITSSSQEPPRPGQP
ncbi:MAG: hypothetical protein O3C27_15080 [Actinomycetota bacterium]|nr:hypothetical protein [Actinomycetota bacterium]